MYAKFALTVALEYNNPKPERRNKVKHYQTRKLNYFTACDPHRGVYTCNLFDMYSESKLAFYLAF